jgi:hypothetical protein
MEDSQAILAESPGASSPSLKTTWQATLRALRAMARRLDDSRSRRVALLLITVWIVGLSDLSLTLTARSIGQFEESNPVAAGMLHDSGMLSAFKLASLVVSSGILLALRKHWFTEAACWFVFAVHIGLALVWLSYFGHMS